MTSKATLGPPRLHRLQPLVANSLGADLAVRRRASARWPPIVGGSIVALERRREARGAQHAQAVLREALDRSRRPRGGSSRSRSFCPSNGSISAGASGSMAIALMVKSRRARSAVMSSTKTTASGRRPSEYVRFSAQRRHLVVHARATSTVTVPCSIPVGITRGKMRITCRVARRSRCPSRSRLLPSERSRTHPPTIQPRLPASRSRSQMPIASRSMRATRASRVGSRPTVYHALRRAAPAYLSPQG